jgi:hypothetical protein
MDDRVAHVVTETGLCQGDTDSVALTRVDALQDRLFEPAESPLGKLAGRDGGRPGRHLARWAPRQISPSGSIGGKLGPRSERRPPEFGGSDWDDLYPPN